MTPFDYIARANGHHLFTGAIPLLLDADTFACCVSALGRDVSPQRTRCIVNSFSMTMLTLSLVWTPDRHRQLHDSGPELKPFESLASKQLDYRCTPLHPANSTDSQSEWSSQTCNITMATISYAASIPPYFGDEAGSRNRHRQNFDKSFYISFPLYLAAGFSTYQL